MSTLRGRGIAFVNNFPGPGLGGGERHLLELVSAALAAGMRVSVVCVPGSGTAEAARAAGAAVVEAPMGVADTLSAVRAIRSHCRASGVEILHTTGFWTNLLGRLAARGDGPLLVNTVHVDPAAAAASGVGVVARVSRRLADRATARRPAIVLAVSEAVGRALPSAGYDAGAVRVIPNGVDVGSIRRKAEPRAVLPAGFDGAPLVGIVARLERVKAVDVFLRAASIVAAERPEARFVVAGEGPMRPELEALAVTLGLGDRVAFLGWVDPAVALIARLDVCVLTSVSEGMPITVLEAMALGVPVVATGVGGVPEVVEHGRTGLVAGSGNVLAIAEHVCRLLDDQALRRRYGDAGRRRVEAAYSLERMRESHLAVWAGLLDRLRGPDTVRE